MILNNNTEKILVSRSLHAPKALYEQVKDHILDNIRSGKWPPDTKIPSENQLSQEFSVSRMTINRALRELADAGILVRIQGVGTYVAQPKPMTALFEITSIDKEIRENGGIYSCKIYLLKEEKADSKLASAMGIMPETLVYHSIIVHKDREKPVMLADRYVNPICAPDYINQDFTSITPSDYLLKVTPVSKVEHIVEAVLPDSMAMKLLAIPSDEPCLVLHRKTWDNSRIATFSKMIYPGSVYRLGGKFKPSSLTV